MSLLGSLQDVVMEVSGALDAGDERPIIAIVVPSDRARERLRFEVMRACEPHRGVDARIERLDSGYAFEVYGVRVELLSPPR